jgi:hypothetical protein
MYAGDSPNRSAILRGGVAVACGSLARQRSARVARSDVFVIIETNQTIFIRFVPAPDVTAVTSECDDARLQASGRKPRWST